MAVNISGLRRSIMNVAHNYTDAQVKVREATSNDPWGPSSTMMSEISDLTYSVISFSEIMQMIWKRLNDSGKNWRHVYKALVLLEYLIKTGSEKVAQQCMENIFVIQTLKDFQYLDDNKDQGINVREKAKSLVALLKDDERLKNERSRALKAKERLTYSTAGIGSDTVYNSSRERFSSSQGPRHGPSPDGLSSDLESARPQTLGEEELQLQLALAMSREEAEMDESKTKSDDMRLQLALQKSKAEGGGVEDSSPPSALVEPRSNRGNTALLDLVDLNFGVQPLGETVQPQPPVRTSASLDPWALPVEVSPWTHNDPWSPIKQKPGGSSNDPWKALSGDSNSSNDPWKQQQQQQQQKVEEDEEDIFSVTTQNQLAEFDLLRDQINEGSFPELSTSNRTNNLSPNPFDLTLMESSLSSKSSELGARPKKNAVESILGEHSNLVNLDNLVSADNNQVRNPFQQMPPNPFQAVKASKPAMNQLLHQNWNEAPQKHNNGELNPFF